MQLVLANVSVQDVCIGQQVSAALFEQPAIPHVPETNSAVAKFATIGAGKAPMLSDV
jgi:hypothetical protein